MTCPNCGSELKSDAVFCAECGTRINSDETVNIDAKINPTADETTSVSNSVSMCDNDCKAENQTSLRDSSLFSHEEEDTQERCHKPPVKKKQKLWIIAAAVVAAIIAVTTIACAAFYPYISNFTARTLNSPEKYMRKVLEKNSKSGASDFAKSYSRVVDIIWNKETSKNQSAVTNISFELGDSILNLLEKQNHMDMSWLKNASISVTSASNKDNSLNKLSQETIWRLGNTDIFSTSYIMDWQSRNIYTGLPDLNSKYIKTPFEDNHDSFSMENMIKMFQEKPSFLPSEAEVKDAALSYSKATIGGIKSNVSISTEEINIESLSKKYTTLTAEIDETTAAEILKNIIEISKKDETLKKLINGIHSFSDTSKDYDDFLDALEETCEDVSNADGQVYFTIWVDNKGKITGTELYAKEKKIKFTSLQILDGNKIAYSAAVTDDEEKMVFTGEGEVKNNILTANGSLKYNKDSIFQFDISDCNLKNFGKDTAALNLVITAGDKVSKEFSSSLSSLGIKGLSDITKQVNLKLEFTLNGLNATAKLSADTKDNNLATVSISNETIKEAKEIIVPSEEQVINYNDSAALTQWILDCDYDKMISALETAGLPANIVTNLKQLTALAKIGYSNPDYFYGGY